MLTAAIAACTFEDVSIDERPIPRVYIVDQDGKRWDVTQAVHRFGYEAGSFHFGLGAQAIPPLVDPPVVSAGEPGFAPADSDFAVVGVVSGAEERAYGEAEVAGWEVVDDRPGGAPVALVYQPFSDRVDAWRRVAGSDTLTMSHSGWTYAQQTVLYDFETESMWHRLPGTTVLTCISGSHVGATLSPVSAQRTTWPQWLSANPQTRLLFVAPPPQP
ncbi:MAG: DUF3179 domain-containing protein [Candidatus Krumholzibacteria bacterium]|nr:DUF3179 domain-containing protein [Candidatus Krumholzibacteria bacterium]